MKGIAKSILYLRALIKKFNDNGDYHIGDELSWALGDMENAQKELETTKKLLEEARSMLDSASEICKREGYIQFMIEINQFLNKLKNERGE